MAITAPTEVFSLRFEREVDGRRVIADVQEQGPPSIPGVDWDATRDRNMAFESPTACLAVITPGCVELKVCARFLRLDPVKWTIWAEDPSSPVLPRVADHTFELSPAGCVSSEVEFSVDATGLGKRVGCHKVTWNWWGTRLDRGALTKFFLGQTKIMVFGILREPDKAPWRPLVANDPARDLLRPAILDVACRAAAGATELAEAASAVTRFLFDLGSSTRTALNRRQFVHKFTDDFVCDREHHVFLSDRFFRALNEPKPSVPVNVGCEDMATALCVCANALGLDLERTIIRSSKMQLNTVTPIGSPAIAPSWGNHHFGFSRGLHGVFDACLQLNMAPAGQPEDWQSPCGLPFGDPAVLDTSTYLHRLVRANAAQVVRTTGSAPVLDRGAIKGGLAPGFFEALAAEYRQRLGDAVVPLGRLRSGLTPEDLKRPDGFEPLPEESVEAARLISATWRAPESRRIRFTVEDVEDSEHALAQAAWRLTFFREFTIRDAAHPAFPEAIYCATEDKDRVLLVYANAVVRLRSEGEAPVDLTGAMGKVLDQILVPPGAPIR